MSWKRTFAFAFAAQLLGVVGISFATPFLPFFVAELGVEESGRQAFWAGIVLASGGVTFALFAPIWGILADRYGRKPMVCRAMFGAAVAVLLMSFARTIPQMVLFRMVQGAFSGTLAASIALVASVVPLTRSGLTLGMMQAAVFVGNAVGPLIGGLAADAFGYRTSFRIGAGLTFLGGLLVLLGTQDRFTPPDPNVPDDSPGFRKILLVPGFLISVTVLLSVRMSNSIANPSFPLIVREIVDAPQRLNSITGSVIGAAAIAAAIAAALLGHLGDRLGRREILIGCCVGASLASIGHYYAHDIPTLFGARVLFGFSVAGMLPTANAMIHERVDPRSIGKAYGLATSLSMLGIALGPTIGGTLAMHAGLRVPFLVTAGAQVGLAAIVLLVLREKRGDRACVSRE